MALVSSAPQLCWSTIQWEEMLQSWCLSPRLLGSGPLRPTPRLFWCVRMSLGKMLAFHKIREMILSGRMRRVGHDTDLTLWTLRFSHVFSSNLFLFLALKTPPAFAGTQKQLERAKVSSLSLSPPRPCPRPPSYSSATAAFSFSLCFYLFFCIKKTMYISCAKWSVCCIGSLPALAIAHYDGHFQTDKQS